MRSRIPTWAKQALESTQYKLARRAEFDDEWMGQPTNVVVPELTPLSAARRAMPCKRTPYCPHHLNMVPLVGMTATQMVRAITPLSIMDEDGVTEMARLATRADDDFRIVFSPVRVMCSVCGEDTSDGHSHGNGRMQALIQR